MSAGASHDWRDQKAATEEGDWSFTGQIVGKRCVGKFLLFADLNIQDTSELIKLAIRPLPEGLSELEVKSLKRDIKLGDTVTVQGNRMESEPGLPRVLHLTAHHFVLMRTGGNTGIYKDSKKGQQDGTRVSTDAMAQEQSAFANNSNRQKRSSDAIAVSPPTTAAETHAAADAEAASSGQDHSSNTAAAAASNQPSKTSKDPHDTVHATLKARVFCEWLVRRFGKHNLAGGSGVLDVAGGKGELSLVLCSLEVPSTVVDPREHSGALSRRQRKQLRRAGQKRPDRVRAYFGEEMLEDPATAPLVEQSSCLIAMHPDEATDAVVNFAVAHRKPFAVVP